MDDPAIGAAYSEASTLVEAAENVWSGSVAVVTVQIAATEALQNALMALLECKIESVFITDSDIRHIKKTHGSNEDNRGQIDISPTDFAILPLIINEFDSITHTDTDKLGNKMLLIIKDIGAIAYVATIQRGKKRMEIKTFWKMRVSGASC